jgi:transcriptional regulator with PAS, ATPase and Fis domain
MVEKNEFRLDLYQRLNVIALNVPPLRDRPEDVPLLVHFFLRKYAGDYPEPILGVDDQVYDILARSIGSGNVRELENALRQILVFKRSGNRLEISDIPPGLLERLASNRDEDRVTEALASAVESLMQMGRMTLPEMVDHFEAMVLRHALARSTVSHAELANRLGLSRRTLYNKLDKHDLSSST